MSESPNGYQSCPSHCCPLHGCKYGYERCPVYLGTVEPEFPPTNGCEYCELMAPDGQACRVEDLQAGQIAYYCNPGTIQSERVEVIRIKVESYHVHVWWKRIDLPNEKKPLSTTYPPKAWVYINQKEK